MLQLHISSCRLWVCIVFLFFFCISSSIFQMTSFHKWTPRRDTPKDGSFAITAPHRDIKDEEPLWVICIRGGTRYKLLSKSHPTYSKNRHVFPLFAPWGSKTDLLLASEAELLPSSDHLHLNVHFEEQVLVKRSSMTRELTSIYFHEQNIKVICEEIASRFMKI